MRKLKRMNMAWQVLALCSSHTFTLCILFWASKLYNGPCMMVIYCTIVHTYMLWSIFAVKLWWVVGPGCKIWSKGSFSGLTVIFKGGEELSERIQGISEICNNPSVVRDFGLCTDEHCIVEVCKVTCNTQQIISNSPHKFPSLLLMTWNTATPHWSGHQSATITVCTSRVVF